MYSAVSSPDSQSTFAGTTPSGPDATDKSLALVLPALPKETSLAHNSPVPAAALTERTIAPSGHHNPLPLPENWQWQFVSGILNGEIEAISGLLQQGADVNSDLSSQIAKLAQQPVNIHGTPPSVTVRLGKTAGLGALCTPLWLAAGAGKLEVVELLLSKGALPDARDYRFAPLEMAAVAGHLKIVRVLLEYKADIQAGSTTGVNSPLYWAVHAGHQDVVEFLEMNGAHLQVGCPGMDALIHESARRGSTNLIEYLLNLGEDIDNHSTGQHTPVYAAAINGHFEPVKLLLERGANNSHGETGYKTLIWAACYSGNLQMVKYLLDQGADINAGGGNTYPWTEPHPIEAAAHSGNCQLLAYLLEHQNLTINTPDLSATLFRHAAEGDKVVMMDYIANRATININETGCDSPISAAARSGSIEAVKWLLEKGANIEANCSGPQAPLCQACARGHFKLVKFLVSKGARLDGNTGLDSPIYFAARAGSIDTVAYLLDRGVSVNADASGFRTPIYIAAQKGLVEMVEYLLDKGAEVNANVIADESLHSPIFGAAFNGHLELVKRLVHKSAAIDAGYLLFGAALGGNCPILEYLFEENTILQRIELSHFSGALIQASFHGHLNAVKYLLRAFETHFSTAPKPDISKPLWMAAQSGHVDVVKYLAGLGANVNVESQNFGSAVWTASKYGHLDTVMYLHQQGADIHYSNPANNTDVLSIAEQMGHQDVAQYLQQLNHFSPNDQQSLSETRGALFLDESKNE
ncbi:ankyrin repeat domain-containing protein [Endozoicomonas sp. ALB091]|uniref:ankyrin repeat domain-containing protein n=1 Tax=Endozoicomonas sp. ALB091 TaxID=3403073 RepID=UPI003BB619CD